MVKSWANDSSHAHAQWLKFLQKIHRETPKDKTLRLIGDNCAQHGHPAVQAGLTRHPHFVMHVTPPRRRG